MEIIDIFKMLPLLVIMSSLILCIYPDFTMSVVKWVHMSKEEREQHAKQVRKFNVVVILAAAVIGILINY